MFRELMWRWKKLTIGLAGAEKAELANKKNIFLLVS